MTLLFLLHQVQGPVVSCAAHVKLRGGKFCIFPKCKFFTVPLFHTMCKLVLDFGQNITAFELCYYQGQQQEFSYT